MSNDPLLDRLAQLRTKIAAASIGVRKRNAHSTAGRIRADVSMLHVFLFRVVQSLLWIRGKVLAPLWRLAMIPIRWAWMRYRRLWDRATYYTDEFGERQFSKVRGGLMILATGIAFTLVDDVALLLWETGLYAATRHVHEHVYLLHSEEIRAHENQFNVKGAHELPFTDANSVYYRVRPHIFHHAWALVNNHSLFFPDFISAAVPPGVSKCIITSYGVRWKFIIRNFDIYPDLLAVECSPMVKVLRELELSSVIALTFIAAREPGYGSQS